MTAPTEQPTEQPTETCYCDRTIVKLRGHVWVHTDTQSALCHPGSDDPQMASFEAEPAR